MNRVKLFSILVSFLFLVGVVGCGDSEPTRYKYPLDAPIITNLRGSNKFVKASIVLEHEGEKMAERITEDIAIVKDAIVTVLRAKTEEDFESEDFEIDLKQELIDAINGELSIEEITNIYFEELVTQRV